MQPDCEIELWACVTEQNGKCARGRRERERRNPWSPDSLSLSLSLSLSAVFLVSEVECVASLDAEWWIEYVLCCCVCVTLTSRLSVHRCSHSKNGTTKEAPEDLRSVSGWLKKSWWMSESESERTFLGHISS